MGGMGEAHSCKCMPVNNGCFMFVQLHCEKGTEA